MAGLTSKQLADGAVWASNFSSSVAIIFINKVLMSGSGYEFRYATTLCACHFLLCACCFWVTQKMGYSKKAELPLLDLVLFVGTANLSIVTLNLSLLLNKVGIYQIAKLLNIPFVAVVEVLYLGKTFTPRIMAAMACVVVGVAIVTVNDADMSGNAFGYTIALVAVFSSGMQQILCRSMQQKHGLSSHELLANVAPAQGFSLLGIGPLLDYFIVGSSVLQYQWTRGALLVFVASCSMAVAVNISQFMCLGRFHAISYQVLGHVKTVLVLFGGWAFLGENVTSRQLGGMVIAIAGMLSYGYLVSRTEQATALDKDKEKGKQYLTSPSSAPVSSRTMKDLGLTDLPPSREERTALLSKT